VLTFTISWHSRESTQRRCVSSDTRTARLEAGRLFGAWRNDPDAFEHYQSVQSRHIFPLAGPPAGFVVTEARKTVFVGMHRVDGDETCPPRSTDPLLKQHISGQFRYDLKLVDSLVHTARFVAPQWAPTSAEAPTWPLGRS
jgi:hypothetical protein